MTTIKIKKDDGTWQPINAVVGPPGPQGEPGQSSSLFEYSFSNNNNPPPTSGQIRTNQTQLIDSTLMYVNVVTDLDRDIKRLLLMLESGSKIYIQDKDDSTVWARYNVTAAPIDRGEYVELGIGFEDGGVSAVNNNEPVMLIVGAPQGPQGDVGPQGPAGPAGPSGNANVSFSPTQPANPKIGDIWWRGPL